MEKKQRIWLTGEQRNEAALRYAAGESLRAIARSMGVCTNNIAGAVKEIGVKLRDKSATATKFGHWKEAFDVITPESAYWIGFLFADGWINRSKVLHLALQKRDREHLFKLRAYLKSEHQVGDYTTSDKVHFGSRKVTPRSMSQFAVSSTPLCEALLRHGMCVKSLTRKASGDLCKSRDFWRGLIDGDGYVGASGNKFRFGVCGGEELMHQFITFLRAHGIAEGINVRQENAIHKVEISCGTAAAAIKLLYEDACVSLDRKRVTAEAVMRDDIESILISHKKKP